MVLAEDYVYPTSESKDKDHKYIISKSVLEIKESMSFLHTDKIKEDAVINKLYLL